MTTNLKKVDCVERYDVKCTIRVCTYIGYLVMVHTSIFLRTVTLCPWIWNCICVRALNLKLKQNTNLNYMYTQTILILNK